MGGMAPRTPKVEVFAGSDGRWFFHKRSANGRIVSPSQGYATASGARRAARREHPGIPVVTLR